MYKIQPIEWRMQNPKQPIRTQKQGKFLLYAPFDEKTLIGQNLVRLFQKREKDLMKQNIKNVHIGNSD